MFAVVAGAERQAYLPAGPGSRGDCTAVTPAGQVQPPGSALWASVGAMNPRTHDNSTASQRPMTHSGPKSGGFLRSLGQQAVNRIGRCGKTDVQPRSGVATVRAGGAPRAAPVLQHCSVPL